MDQSCAEKENMRVTEIRFGKGIEKQLDAAG